MGEAQGWANDCNPEKSCTQNKGLGKRESSGLTLNSQHNLEPVESNASNGRRMQVFRSAGILPAIFPASTHRKNAGETPALQKWSRYPAGVS
jgi:hypothetical protein